MKIAQRALLIGCNNYQYCRPLTGCEYDAEQLANFLIDPGKGGLPESTVILLRSPTLERVKQALNDTCRVVGGDDLMIVYVSGHGLLTGAQPNVHLAFSDTNPDYATFSALPLTQVVALMMECGINASIMILDLCFSGAHSKAAAELLMRQTYGDRGAFGHFIFASSSADEVSVANLGGGAFTQLLLEQANQLGRERPFERFISFTALAAATIAESPRVLKQRPCWTGISVSEQIAFCQNPYWDPKVTTPDTALSLHGLRHVDRARVADVARSFARSMIDVGTESPWIGVVSGALLNAAVADISEESASTLIAAMVESACERTRAYGVEADQDQLSCALEAAVIAIAARHGLDRPEGSLILFRLAELAHQQIEIVDFWRMHKGWIRHEDGPATIGIAPIRFWDILGKTCLIAVAADALGATGERQQLIELVTTTLKANPALWRIEWAGQYPDIALNHRAAISINS
jgi:hypothetical protein